MKPNLGQNFAGLELKNPIIIASGPLGWSASGIKRCARAGAAAVVTKSIIEKPVKNPKPGLFVRKIDGKNYMMCNIERSTVFDLQEWQREIETAKKEVEIPIIASISAETPDKASELACFAQNCGADMVELEISCPHKKQGQIISSDPKLAKLFTKTVKKSIDIPLMVKLSPSITVTQIPIICKAVKDGGATAISAINSVPCIIGVDLETAMPLLSLAGGLSGPAIKPIGLRFVADASKAVNLPISGIGGIMTYEDVLEYMMLGASTVQLCTAVLWKGPQIIGTMVNEIERWMTNHKIDDIQGIVGKALPNYITYNELNFKDYVANINVKLCSGCGICATSCPYEAIEVSNGTSKVVAEKCHGCGLCSQLCPRNAVT